MPKFVMKKRTGDVWKILEVGQWVKVHRGLNTKPTSKPVGYVGYNFFPYNKPGKYKPVECLTDSCGNKVYA